MTVFTINTLEDAAHAYLAAQTDERRDELFVAVEEWIAAGYEADGEHTEEELNMMDFASAAKDYLQRLQQDRANKG